MYEAIYREASAVNRLLEEAELALSSADAAVVALETRRFLTDGAWAHQDDLAPAEVLAAEINAGDDAGAHSSVRICLTCAGLAPDSESTLRVRVDFPIRRLHSGKHHSTRAQLHARRRPGHE